MATLTKITEIIDDMKSMMESCYCYGALRRNNSYLLQYQEYLGEKIWNDVYTEHRGYLVNTYRVEEGTYTDSEGVTYNSLVKI